jgi:hypothetical protein
MLRRIVIASAIVAGLGLSAALAQSSGQSDTVQPAGDWRKAMCVDPSARVVGRLAFLEVKLELSDAQRPLWDKWNTAVRSGIDKERTACLKDVAEPDDTPTIVERTAHFQEFLAAKAESLKAAQPALEALYQALTPEQKAILNEPVPGMWHHEGRWRGMRPAMRE